MPPSMMTRRRALRVLGATAVTPYCAFGSLSADGLEQKLAAIEKTTGGRLGVAIYDSASGKRTGYRADERFPMCSTFKALAAAAILHRVDVGSEVLSRPVHVLRESIVGHSPMTEKYAGREAVTLAMLCEAAVTYSDNTAANLMLEGLGGPAAVTAYVRSLGDTVTRLARNEPTMNDTVPGDPRDTTSPNATLADYRTLVLGNALKPESRDLLIGWLKANTTGDARLRAGAPKDWIIGDKTGSNPDTGTTNDIGVMWPPDRKPIFAAVFLTAARVGTAEQNAAIAAVARLLKR